MRTILIALCGKSPAVITETVYALSKESTALLPDEVIAITTNTGANCIKSELLDSGVWEQLRCDLKISDKLQFGRAAKYLRRLPAGNDNGDAEDILTTADNYQAADYILAVLREFTEDPDTNVVFSISGGRKTMSALGALCMTLLGRNGDRLCHILVNPPFDDPRLSPKFYYPVRKIKQYVLPDGSCHSADNARLILCDLPFIRARNLFNDKFMRLPGTFTATVAQANQSLTHVYPDLVFVPTSRQCRIGEINLKLSPFEFLLYLTLADHRIRNQSPFTRTVDLMDTAETISAEARFSEQRDVDYEAKFIELHEQAIDNVSDKYCVKVLSSLKQKICHATGSIADLYLPSTRKGIYGIELPPGKIIIK